MMDKINRPPLQCSVIRREETGKLPRLSDLPGTKGTLVPGPGGTIPASIQAHMDKVSKMRIFEDAPFQPGQETGVN